MKRIASIVVGLIFIALGGVGLAFSIFLPSVGHHVWMWGLRRFWPLAVIAAGLLLSLIPLLTRHRRAKSLWFFLGLPILTTGGVLLFTNLFDAWHAWEWLWPLEVLSVGLSFLFAAAYARAIWLLLPAIVIGTNGLVFQFCAITGWWEAWAVLWAIEPLSVGLALLAVGARKRSSGLVLSGTILSALAGVCALGMSAIFSWWWLGGLVGPSILILIGVGILLGGILRRAPKPEPAG
ncbi:MAG: hypothetical protein JXD18_12720 [Anaerolineae bacterium]|nr:hypothetical protein [Anaerolineae bacterium]